MPTQGLTDITTILNSIGTSAMRITQRNFSPEARTLCVLADLCGKLLQLTLSDSRSDKLLTEHDNYLRNLAKDLEVEGKKHG